MKKSVFFLLALFVLSQNLRAELIEVRRIKIAYDNAGNRIIRYLHVDIIDDGETPGGQGTGRFANFDLEDKKDNNSREISQKETENFKINVYPNPSSGIVNISVEEKKSSAFIKLFLFDKLGKKVLEKNLTYSNLQSVDLSMLKQGTYLLIVQTENNQEKFEIIKTL